MMSFFLTLFAEIFNKMKQTKSIKSWSVDDRPREKLMSKGTDSLSDSELLAIILGSGNKTQSAVDLAREILNSCKNNLNTLGRLYLSDLKKFEGIGNAKAISVIAAMELGRRRKVEDISNKKIITSSKDVFDLFHPVLTDKVHEEFWIILLNNSNIIIDKQRTSQGGTTGTVMDIKLIMKHALNCLAQGIILVHNHPSGSIKPSSSDINITSKIKQAALYFDIKLLDHIIIGGDNYYSFADYESL